MLTGFLKAPFLYIEMEVFTCYRLCYKGLSALSSLGVSVTRVNLVYAGKHGGRITTPLYLLNEEGARDSSSCSEVFGID